MNKYHQEIIVLYGSFRSNYCSKHASNYSGSTKFSYSIRALESRKLIRDWLKEKTLTLREYKELLDDLSGGKSHSEFGIIGKLLEFLPEYRKKLDPKSLCSWLDYAEGWAEVDCICQGNFTVEELLSRWPEWRQLVQGFSNSENVHKRRASLVLLTGPVRHSVDKRLSNLAFKNIDKLKEEKDILITKAVSWLLRDLIKNHRVEVEDYLKKNIDNLPKIAVRETKNKLKSGRKSGK